MNAFDADRRRSWFTAPTRKARAEGAEDADPVSGSPPSDEPSGPWQRGAGAPPAGAGSLPSISLPKGGGAIRGIDEKLSVSQPTGTASLTVGVFTSAARQGFGPKLALSYDSGAGNGPFGLGWTIGVPAITRKTSKGLPRYEDASDSDVFIMSGAEDLVPLLINTDGIWTSAISTRTIGASTYLVRAYRPRVEAEFARIERWQDTASGDVHWRTISRQNLTSLYGQEQGSRISDPDDPARIFSWLLDFSFDDRGNAVSYVYKAEDGSNVPNAASEANRTRTANRYLKRVLYGNDIPYDGEAPPAAVVLRARAGLWRARSGRAGPSRRVDVAVPARSLLELSLRFRGQDLPDLPAAADVPSDG